MTLANLIGLAMIGQEVVFGLAFIHDEKINNKDLLS